MSSVRRFAQVDVFTSEPTLGNPVAVVLDGARLRNEQMQAFTDWTNLSEATFVTPASNPTADYAVRIFCPGRELPFAGHPTLGTCHAWLESGGQPKSEVIVQECGVGLVRIRRGTGSRLSFAAPPLRRSGPLTDSELDVLVHGLGLDKSQVADHQWCDNGPGWQGILVDSVDTLRAIAPDGHLLAGLDVGVVAPSTDGADFEVRAFFPGNNGLTEDPVTGSLNAALAQWLIGSGRAPDTYTASQGRSIGRDGRVFVERIDSDIWIGGESTTVITGSVLL
jgi:PhzF family phenazine biosynthesis protein